MHMRNFELVSFPNDATLADRVAIEWLKEIESASRNGRQPCVALSGGRIAQKFFASVAENARARAVSLEQAHFFWADERCVAPTDAESNYLIARRLLFGPLKIPDSRTHRIRGEDSPEATAQSAEAEIRRIAPRDAGGQPVLDLVFLGMGEDGHVASLFPGEPETAMAGNAVYRAVKNAPKPPPNRVTLGYPAIVAAREVWVLASGAGKEAALRQSLSPTGGTPLARVLKLRDWTRIFTDIAVQ
jgi:6-phosphogluconolactonase